MIRIVRSLARQNRISNRIIITSRFMYIIRHIIIRIGFILVTAISCITANLHTIGRTRTIIMDIG